MFLFFRNHVRKIHISTFYRVDSSNTFIRDMCQIYVSFLYPHFEEVKQVHFFFPKCPF